jgi:hypothetical protein
MRGEADAAALAAHQHPHAQQLLQPLHLHRNSGLGAPDARSGTGETALLRDAGEAAQQVGIDRAGQGHGIRMSDSWNQIKSFGLWLAAAQIPGVTRRLTRRRMRCAS